MRQHAAVHLVVNVLATVAIVAVAVVLLRRRRRRRWPRTERGWRRWNEQVNERGIAHLVSLVHDGTVSVDELIRNQDELLAEPGTADPAEIKQFTRRLLSDLAADPTTTETDRDKIVRYLDQT